MIPAEALQQHIIGLPSEPICDGAIRKYVDTDTFGRIYLHPKDPRFGADLNGNLYSFKRPMGARGTSDRKAGVNYEKPKLTRGHKVKDLWKISTDARVKRNKMNFMNEIYYDSPFSGASLSNYLEDTGNFSPESLRWNIPRQQKSSANV